MPSDRVVTEADEVIALIRLYNKITPAGPMQLMIGYARNWYAMREGGSGWIFGPTKFIGYVGNLDEAYSNEERDGRMLESVLSAWFEPVGEGHVLEAELRAALRRFIAARGKAPNQLARIHVLKRDVPGLSPLRRQPQNELSRITADPEILSGKPCIRGLRIRVSDILEMLAGGATREGIIEDYPYLEDGDITAALEFAANAVDHRLIKAA